MICTYNRADLLADSLRSVLRQSPAPSFEVVLVDNNSTDSTRTVVAQLMREWPALRYVFEPEQGLSYARNAGIRAARGALLAFTDDDVRMEPDWLLQIVRAFREHPEADFVGGRVLPDWPAPPPPWLTVAHWAPLALVDYGSAPLRVSTENPICLVGANVAFRRNVFDRIGLFSPSLQRVRDGVGSCEDHELLLRLFHAGCTGWYDPRISGHAAIQIERLDKQYHRRWHAGHGHFYAVMRSEHFERSHFGKVLGVPLHLYRQAAGDLTAWVRAALRGQRIGALVHEMRLRFFAGFIRTRVRESLRRPGEVFREIGAIVRSPFRRGSNPSAVSSR